MPPTDTRPSKGNSAALSTDSDRFSQSGQAGPAPVQDSMHRYPWGDSDALGPVYSELAPRLFRYLLRLCRRRELAEDLLQVTFLKAHRQRGLYVGGLPVAP
jgi:hypothetical protein